MSDHLSPPADFGHLAMMYGDSVWLDEEWEDPQSMLLAGDAIVLSMVCGLAYGQRGQDVHVLIRLAPMLMLPEAQRCLRPRFRPAKHSVPGHRYCYTDFDVQTFRHEYFRWDSLAYGSLREHEGAMCGARHCWSPGSWGEQRWSEAGVFWVGFWGEMELASQIISGPALQQGASQNIRAGALCGGHIEVVMYLDTSGCSGHTMPRVSMPRAHEAPMARSQAINRYLAKNAVHPTHGSTFTTSFVYNLLKFGAAVDIFEALFEISQCGSFTSAPTFSSCRYTLPGLDYLIQRKVIPVEKVPTFFSQLPPTTPQLQRELMRRYDCAKPTIMCFVERHDTHRFRLFLEADLVDFSRESWMAIFKSHYCLPSRHIKLALEYYCKKHHTASWIEECRSRGGHVLQDTDIADALYLAQNEATLGLLLEFGGSPNYVPPERSLTLRQHLEGQARTNAYPAKELISTLDGFLASQQNPRLFE